MEAGSAFYQISAGRRDCFAWALGLPSARRTVREQLSNSVAQMRLTKRVASSGVPLFCYKMEVWGALLVQGAPGGGSVVFETQRMPADIRRSALKLSGMPSPGHSVVFNTLTLDDGRRVQVASTACGPRDRIVLAVQDKVCVSIWRFMHHHAT